MPWSTEEVGVTWVDNRDVVRQLQDNLRNWRRNAGFTQAQASEYLGVAKATYNRWEKRGDVGAVGMWILAKYGVINATDYRGE